MAWWQFLSWLEIGLIPTRAYHSTVLSLWESVTIRDNLRQSFMSQSITALTFPLFTFCHFWIFSGVFWYCGRTWEEIGRFRLGILLRRLQTFHVPHWAAKKTLIDSCRVLYDTLSSTDYYDPLLEFWSTISIMRWDRGFFMAYLVVYYHCIEMTNIS